MSRSLRRSALALLTLLALALPASALTIDFEGFADGAILADPMRMHPGYTLIVDNVAKGDFDVAVAFRTVGKQVGNTLEPDLLFDDVEGWSGGNIASEEIGNILIIQANGNCNQDLCLDPEDEGRRPAGTLDFRLDLPASGDFSFDLVDIEDSTMENGSIAFHWLDAGQEPEAGNLVASFSFADFEGVDGVTYGNNSANRVQIEGLGTYNAAVVTMGGSGGIDNLEFSTVPEPATALLVSMGLGALAVGARRRSRP